MNVKLQNILFLDIETVPIVENHTALDERMKAQWSRKASFLKKEEKQTDAELFHQQAGIYAEFGKIVAIAVGMLNPKQPDTYTLRTKHFSSHDEAALLQEFKQLVEKMNPVTTRLCAHNGKEFDFPYISRRMLINGISLPSILDLRGKKPWEVLHLDTMDLWKFGDYKHYTSLDLLTAIFNIPTSKNTMDGSQVSEVYYKENDLDKISQYCIQDVIAIVQLYLKMQNLPIILPENTTQVQ